MRSRVTGTGGFVLAILLACAMSAVEFFIGAPQPLPGKFGICLPSPNLWGINPVASWIVNLILMIALGIALQLFNKTYNFISSNDTVLPAAFIFLCGANTWIDGQLSASLILMGANLICLNLMFKSYRSQKGMQQLFIVGSVLALGSMFQYAFLFFIPAYVLIALTIKCLNLKSLIAFILGIIAPFWVGIGLGLIPLDRFAMPSFSNIFGNLINDTSIFIGLLNCAITVVITLILALYNAVKLYAGNTRRRLFNNSIIVLGLFSTLCILFDMDNISVYIATIYMVMSVQLADLFALHNVRHPHGLVSFIVILYLASFVLMQTGLSFLA